MRRALIFALILGMAAASMYEWKGIFYTPDDKYIWGAQKVGGSYADPTMMLAAIPVSGATQAALDGASGAGTVALGGSCEAVQSAGTIVPMEGKCYKLVFDQQSSQSLFHIDASAATAIAFFAEHLPTEFEETEHYLKDTTGVDIEPVAQEPDGGHAHAHGHGGGEDEFLGKCVCQAQEHNWVLDCTDQAKISTAISFLDGKAACKAVDPPQECINQYYVLQAHHDHCLHDDLPTGAEHKLHEYEHFYDDCFVKRQFDTKLSVCPAVDCADSKTMTEAVATLQKGCTTTQACADPTCAEAIKIVLAAHDLCPEDKLPNNLEAALHDHEEPCEAQLCNSAPAAFDPYNDPCTAEAGAASGFSSKEVCLVTTSALIASSGLLISS
eukprot:gnl/TRDRNA2_/TRDRNA2_171314_c1_seq7.p1 gnl/TRDRNA2_/TRDRNA2_171314_c1~~gnl/TRDRNA2_/TRDRNA2_171314_c1_seq7.p1  ORF type:complete len:405 (-),score=75.41 gnl/TRDRNA2_/TRDRNA2_171314_c1_seq7:112-1260(-)